MENKSKAQYAEQVRAEHLAIALSTSDAQLKEWSLGVYAEFKTAENAWLAARATAQARATARTEARITHRTQSTPENSAAWKASVIAVEEANQIVREVRDRRNYLSALSELLATLLRERRNAAGTNPSDNATNTNQLANNNNQTSAFAAVSTATATTEARTAIRESCPFCTHTYTVRDGTLPQVDAEGNRLQLRKCMCRELAPPCKNCPNCKVNQTIMKAEGDEQLRLCREEFKCEICACECPGAGKWVQGDEDSRSRFRERTAKRHAELSALLQGSWDDNNNATTTNTTAVNGPPLSMRRLPADIKDQIIAAHAAESLFTALDAAAAGLGGGAGVGVFGGSLVNGGGVATTSNHYHGGTASGGGAGCGGRVCCGEAITTVKRRRLEGTDANETTEYGRGHRSRRNNAIEQPALPPPPTATAAAVVEDGSYHSHHHHEGCGDHCDHNHNHDHHNHNHNHVHRCDHPHGECTSDCCSAMSNA